MEDQQVSVRDRCAQNPPTPPTAPRLLTRDQAATLAGCSPRTWARLCDAGKTPQPVRLGRLVRWDRDALEAWIGAGCPAMPKGGRK